MENQKWTFDAKGIDVNVVVKKTATDAFEASIQHQSCFLKRSFSLDELGGGLRFMFGEASGLLGDVGGWGEQRRSIYLFHSGWSEKIVTRVRSLKAKI